MVQQLIRGSKLILWPWGDAEGGATIELALTRVYQIVLGGVTTATRFGGYRENHAVIASYTVVWKNENITARDNYDNRTITVWLCKPSALMHGIRSKYFIFYQSMFFVTRIIQVLSA